MNRIGTEEDLLKEKTNDSFIQKLLALLPLRDKTSSMPLHRLQERLLTLLGSSDLVDKTISKALQEGLVDKVIDYEEVEEGLQPLRPSWHLKRLGPQERHDRLRLRPVEWALLKLLWQQNDPRLPGQLPLDEANRRLSEDGFSETETRLVSSGIPDLVHWYLADDRGANGSRMARTIEWLGILEEARRHPSPEYSAASKEADEEFSERQRVQELLLEETIQQHKDAGPYPRSVAARKELLRKKERLD